jgi:polysaccharide deacetylase family sporulation protein PdaB
MTILVTCFASAMVGMGRTVLATVSGRLVPIYRVARDERVVSITLDATWGDDQTEALLDLLDRYGVKTTFFLAGHWIESYPDKVKLIAARGHEIGNHSWTHPHMSALSEEQIRTEIQKTQDAIAKLTGVRPTLFRPPFGDYNNRLITVAMECGCKTIQWSIDSLDWENLAAEQIHKRIMSRLHNGAIILFHNAGKNTVRALDMILRDLAAGGYRAMPVSELLLSGDYYVDRNTGEQRPAHRKTPPTAPQAEPKPLGRSETERGGTECS